MNTEFTVEQNTAIVITTCVLMVILVAAFIVWLFLYGKKRQDLEMKKLELEIKKLGIDIVIGKKYIVDLEEKSYEEEKKKNDNR